MNTKLIAGLVGLLAVSSASASLEAASTDGSLPADIAAIPLCGQEELANAGFVLTNNDRKKMCQTQIKVQELLKIKPEDTTALKAMCSNVACTAALKALYPLLPDCRFKDWPFKLTLVSELKYCGIDPAKISNSTEAPSNSSDPTPVPTTKAPANWTASSSSGAGPSFAPIGEVPSPSPTTFAPASPVPSTTPKSAGNSLYASTAAAIVVAVAAVAL